LTLVLAFSLGLGTVLGGLGIMLVYAKRTFKYLPELPEAGSKWLPFFAALGITLLGLIIATKALLEIL
jgi:ABC-type nickel/cobalt efflux system permease component RcnA